LFITFLERKRRAIQPSSFGKALTSLLETDIPSSKSAGSSAVKSPGAHLLALNPSIARKQNDERLEKKARKQLAGEKKEHEHVSRVRDVIGGWGGESERGLRKVAQRGGTSTISAAYLVS
jgi:Rrp15p